jgi:hypothetical protein
MTTSEQARAWAKAEAAKRREGETIPQSGKPFVAADNAGAEWGILHVLSLLESEQAVRAMGAEMAVLELPDSHTLDDRILAREKWHQHIYHVGRITAAAVAAITNQETGGSENG